jgi:hypothetical protein
LAKQTVSIPADPTPESVVEKIDSSTVTQEIEVATNSTQYDHHENDVPVATHTESLPVDYSETLRGHVSECALFCGSSSHSCLNC